MRISILCAFLILTACEKPNPDACCTTQEQCDIVGLDGLTGCKADHVCNANGACVAPECSTSADCTSPDRPVCINQLCVATCKVDDDCNGLSGTPHCGADGACVACVDDTQCTASAPVCDSGAHICRGCAADADCPDHVCLESQGICAAQSDVIYLRADGSDAGTCSATAPCLTLGYAFQQLSGARHVIHLFGTTLNIGSSAVGLPSQTTYIDGEDTTLQYDGSGAAFYTQFGTTELSHVIVGRTMGMSFSISSGTVDLFASVIKGGITLSGGAVNVISSVIEHTGQLGGIQCSNGGTIAVRSSIVHDKVYAHDCPTTLERDRFDSTAGAFSLDGSVLMTIENNLITSTDYFTDAGAVEGVAGSAVRFNTFVNLSGVDMGGTALFCNGVADVSSNIFAWHSSSAPTSCSPRYSLFDQVVGLQPGDGNRSADASTFFVDLQGSDFHLAPGSPAIDGAEAGLPVSVDLDGHPRPNGSASDMGAYEAP